MKWNKFLKLCLSFLMFISLTGCMQQDKSDEEVNPEDEIKILITYYSHSGNTQELSAMIHNEVGGTLEELFTVQDYPPYDDDLLEVAKKEKAENARPELAKSVRDPQDFDIMYLGFPIWCETMPMALYTYLEQYDTAGVTIVPFATESGSGFGDSIEKIKELCPDATVLEGFYVDKDGLSNAGQDVHDWLDAIGMLKDKKEEK